MISTIVMVLSARYMSERATRWRLKKLCAINIYHTPVWWARPGRACSHCLSTSINCLLLSFVVCNLTIVFECCVETSKYRWVICMVDMVYMSCLRMAVSAENEKATWLKKWVLVGRAGAAIESFCNKLGALKRSSVDARGRSRRATCAAG